MQLSLDFEPGLTERYPRLIDAVRAQVYQCGKALKVIAADMDLSQSDLSRKLAENDGDPRRLSVDEFERLIVATDSHLALHWLVEKFLESADTRRDRALTELQRQLPAFMALLKTATSEKP